MNSAYNSFGRGWTAVLMLAAATCSDPLAPFEPEIGNNTDTFQLQATDVRNVTKTIEYTWRNTGTVANVNHSTTTTGGSVRIVILAANGTQVYDKALVPSLNETTAPGTSGDWKIRLLMSNYSGTVNFRVQKP